MNIKRLLTTFVVICCTYVGFHTAYAADQLVQVTKESQLVSGRAYKLYYVSNSTGCYVKAETDKFSIPDGSTYNGEDADYYFISDGNGKWKIQSKTKHTYFPEPTGGETFTPTDNAESAGLWTLNFLEGKSGIFAPYSGSYCLDRSNSVLHSNTKDNRFPRNVNQFKLYEWVGIFDAEGKVYTLKDASDWMLIPAGGIYYYLYNTSISMFAYPSSNGNWETKNNVAVPLRVVKQGENTYQLSTKDGTKTFTWNSQTDFEIVESAGSIPDVYTYLLGGQTAVTDVSSQVTDGWYALRISDDSEHPEYVGNFLNTLETPYGMGTIEYPYPVGHGGTYDQHPSKDDATYYFYLSKVEKNSTTYYHWMLPNGVHIVNYLNNFPIMYHQPLSDFIIGSSGENTYYIQSSDFRTKAYDGYIGKTDHKYQTSSTKLSMYKVDLSSAELTPWKVVFNNGADEVPLTCTREDVKGLNVAYNGGYFFLPSSVTPEASEFTNSDAGFVSESTTVDASKHEIQVLYAPDICFQADNVTVDQGSRTTGLGNSKQVLLRVKIVPQAPCTLSSLSLNLSGVENMTAVEAYLTNADQLHAEGVTPTSLGSVTPGTNESVTITTSGSPVLKMKEDYYVWITATITDTSTAESETVDAAITSIIYTNAKPTPTDNTVNVSSKGNPDGYMRIFKRQSFVCVSTENNGSEAQYYRNPAILSIAENNVLAFYENRYDNPNGLGKDYVGSNYGHRIDVLVKKSADNGKTWGNPVTIAAGSEGENPAGYSGPAVVKTGSKIICLMAQGTNSYDAGLTSVYMSTSSDGASWTTPTAISINWPNSVSATSYYVTPGKGVVYNSRVAFVINAKVNGSLKEYLLYSDDAGSTWNVDPTPLLGKGKESKLEVKNNGTDLLVMGKTPASRDNNNDLLYFKRSGEGGDSYDGIFQTVIYSGTSANPKDLRLYVSYDQATTWKEMFYIQPYYAATNSMQKLSDGDLAICFEDGSIGYDENSGCYALTYVVINQSQIVNQSANINTATIIHRQSITGSEPNVSFGSGWNKSVTTNSKSDVEGVVISANHGAFNRSWYNNVRYFCIKPSAAGATDVITIQAPPGYVIQSYRIGGFYLSDSETYTLSGGGSNVAVDTAPAFTEGSPTLLTQDNILTPTATFSIKSNGATNNSYALITQFEITLTTKNYGVTLHQVNEGIAGKSYATLYEAYDLQTDENTKAYYITEIEDGKAILTETPNEGRDIPKLTAVVLINSEGSTNASFTYSEGMESIENISANMLEGTLEGTSLNLGNNSNYYTFGRRKSRPQNSNSDDDWSLWVAGFYNNGGTITLAAHRAYLVTNAPAPSFEGRVGFDFWSEDDSTTDIKTLSANDNTNGNCQGSENWYDLQGRKVNTHVNVPVKKGLYIVNGRKVFIK